MNRIARLLSLFLFAGALAFGALSNSTVWEIRPTVGSDTNGGGFVAGASGTDYSQQNAKNSTGNNISTTDAVGTGVATITSATGNFSSAIVGNIIYLTGTGVTTGWYQVVTFTNVTTIILDRSPGTFTGGTMNIGGAMATVSGAVGAGVLSNTFWIRGSSGTYTATSALSLAFLNAPTPMIFNGYGTTRGDGVQAVWTTSTNSIHLITFGTGGPTNYMFKSIKFTNTAGTPLDAIHALGSTTGVVSVQNCFFSGFRYAINGNFAVDWQINLLQLDGVEITGSTVDGVINSGNTVITESYLHGNTGYGVNITDFQGIGGLVLRRTVLQSNGASGAILDNGTTSQSEVYIDSANSAFVSNTADGLRVTNSHTGTAPPMHIINSIFSSNGGWGINLTGGGDGYAWGDFRANAYYNNTSGTITGGIPAGIGDVTLSASPFNSSTDFGLNSTAGGGAACKGVGWQGGALLSAGGAIDIGPVQSAGGGGSSSPVGFVSQ